MTRSTPIQHESPPGIPRRTGFFVFLCPRPGAPATRPRREELYRILERLHNAPSRSARRRHTARPEAPTSTGHRPHWKLCPHPAGRSDREAPTADDQPHTRNPCPSRPAHPAPAFVLEHPRRTQSCAPSIHTQTTRSSSAGLYCQAMPPGILHKAHCKAHGKAFFQE